MDPQTNSGTTEQTTQTTGTESTATAVKTDAPVLTDGKSSLLGAALDGVKTDDTKSADAKSDATAAEKPAVPEKYEFKPIDGFTLEGETFDKAVGMFKEAGLSQDAAQKFVEFHADALRAATEGPYKLWQDTQDAWLDELRSDPKIGKSIDNGEVGASVSKMISALPVEQATAFREALNFTGAGNNPAIVRGLYELSRQFSEPGHVQGQSPVPSKAPGTGRPSPAAALYPNLVKKES